MTDRIRIRRARPDEAALLGEIMLRSLEHWGHHQAFPDMIEDLRQNAMPTPEYVEESRVFVLAEDGQPVGFYGLLERDEFVDLQYMFLDTGYIGKGHGRQLWQHALEEARRLPPERMRIISDPKAVGFYSAMGAEQLDEREVKPGFVLGIFWIDVNK